MTDIISIAEKEVIVEIVPSALNHGQTEEDILSALDNSIYDETLEVDVSKTLVVGFDTKANLLELIMHVVSEELIIVFHAMPCRKVYIDRILK
jgi:hypothetical protein